MPIGDRLEALIEQRGTNPNKLSLQTGVSVNTIYSIIKRNNLKADLSVLQSLALALGVTLDYFLEGGSPVPDGLSEKELRLVEAYHAKPEFQGAVDALLGIGGEGG